MRDQDHRYLSALAGDVLAATGLPGSNMLSTALQEVLQKRKESGTGILLEELRRGERQLSGTKQVDAGAAIVFRYARAAQEGAARLNLRLMAKVIANQAHRGNLIADEFLYYADILSSLRREEVVLLGTMLRVRDGMVAEVGSHVAAHELWKHAMNELIPVPFANEELMRATASAVTRTGLLMTGASFDDMGHWSVSPLLQELATMASLEDALNQERE